MALVETPPSSTFSPFDTVPNELLDWIFGLLPLQGLLAARDVCHLWRSVIEKNSKLQDNKLFLGPEEVKYYLRKRRIRLSEFKPGARRRRHELPNFELWERKRASWHRIKGSNTQDDIEWRPVIPIGHVSDDFFTIRAPLHHHSRHDATQPWICKHLDEEGCTLLPCRDPRQNNGLYMEAYKNMYVTQPPRTSIHMVAVVFPIADEQPDLPPLDCTIIAARCQLAIENAAGVRLGDIIREVEKAELQHRGTCNWSSSTIYVRDFKCVNAEDLGRYMLQEDGSA